ncbi:hypothetical protein HMSSN139_43530 [Paenibacillus sp. HMSSN-139]|nr:hypothetical protein HMSSN139_43530 [Paenibacillus sp. HMSSN-139]
MRLTGCTLGVSTVDEPHPIEPLILDGQGSRYYTGSKTKHVPYYSGLDPNPRVGAMTFRSALPSDCGSSFKE